jgi:hypothetical protein
MPVPKEQPPRKLSGDRDRTDTEHSGEILGHAPGTPKG